TIFVAEKAKKDAIRKVEHVSDLLVDAVNGGFEECFINEKRIELEIRALAATVTQFIKQTDQWLLATHFINTAIKVLISFFYYRYLLISYLFIIYLINFILFCLCGYTLSA
ncbi:GCN5L1 domain-containing protein, partial [Cephalotus follicularis]